MGPRLLSRGKANSFRGIIEQLRRFNGAAAVEPRKGRPSLKSLRACQSLQWGRGC